MAVTHFWLNDALVKVADAKVSVLDHGFTVADGVFETLKVADGEVFALDRHLRRLGKSAQGLGIAMPEFELIRKGAAEVLASAGKLVLGRMRITVTSGNGPLGSDRTNAEPTLVISLAEQNPWPAETSILLVPWARNEKSPLVGLKTTSYAENVFALEAAHARGYSEAILRDSTGRLSEGTGSNIFLIIGDEVVTPSISSGLLQGITRELVIEWATADGHKVVERDVSISELWEAAEVFITSSTRDVHPVTKLAELNSAGEVINERSLEIGSLSTKLSKLFKTKRIESINP
jgi:branched-chain amino acid aminotransferase